MAVHKYNCSIFALIQYYLLFSAWSLFFKTRTFNTLVSTY